MAMFIPATTLFSGYKLGNIRDHSLIDMLYGEQQQEFSRLKHSSLPRQCKECDMEFACHGECPKNRFMKDKYGDSGLNYLCPGYYHYYQHVAPYMDYMEAGTHGAAPTFEHHESCTVSMTDSKNSKILGKKVRNIVPLQAKAILRI